MAQCPVVTMGEKRGRCCYCKTTKVTFYNFKSTLKPTRQVLNTRIEMTCLSSFPNVVLLLMSVAMWPMGHISAFLFYNLKKVWESYSAKGPFKSLLKYTEYT